MNPLTGLDVVRTNLITSIHVEGEDKKLIKIKVDLAEDHQFAATVKQDIMEKLQHRWDVDKIIVNFSE